MLCRQVAVIYCYLATPLYAFYIELRSCKLAQRDTIKDIISDSQVNSYFPYRWSQASLYTINKDISHLKSPKNQNRRAALGRQQNIHWGGGGLTSLRSTNPRP